MQCGQLKRRSLITLLGGAAAAWPLAARNSRPRRSPASACSTPGSTTPSPVDWDIGPLSPNCKKLGFTEGRNLVIDYGRTDQGADKAFADAATMARSNVAVIVASGSELPLQAAVAASPSVPIVILANNYDPIARGYVTSLARPGGRITGLFNRQPELAQKRV